MKSTADQVKEGMTKAGSGQPVMEAHESAQPHKGEHFRCDRCGMEVEVLSDCHCHHEEDHFHCCGAPMHKA